MKKKILLTILCVSFFSCLFGQIGNQLSKEGYEKFLKAGKLIEQAGEIEEIDKQTAKFIEAIVVLEKITESDPDIPDIFYNLSVLYKNIGLSTSSPEFIKKAINNFEKYRALTPSEDKRSITQKIEIELATEKVWVEVEKEVLKLKVLYNDKGKVNLNSFYALSSYPEIKAIEMRAKKKMKPWAIPGYIFGMPGAAAVGAGLGMIITYDEEYSFKGQMELSKKLLLYGGCAIAVGTIFNTIGAAKFKKVINHEIPLYNNSIDSRIEKFKNSKPYISLGITNSGELGFSFNF